MASRHRGDRAAAGFSVKSGWASAVLVVGTSASPAVAASETVELSDPAVPESRQPYHDGFGTARAAGRELSRLIASVEQFGGQSVKSLLGRFQAGGHDLRGAGVVVGSLIDPTSIAQRPHQDPCARGPALSSCGGGGRRQPRRRLCDLA